MTTAYTDINMSRMGNFSDYLVMSNSVSGGWFWTGMDFMIFAVLFVTLATTFGFEAGFLVACFIGLLMSVFLVYLALIPMWIALIYVGGIIIMIIYINWRNPYD